MFFFQAVNADPKLSFSDTLSTDNFILYLRQEGLSDKDCKKMRGNILCTLSDLLTASNITQVVNGIGPKIFAKLMEDNIDSDLDLTLGGKILLKTLLKEIKV